MTNIKEQIRAEIERRNLANYCGTAEQYEEELFAILDSLPEEKPSKDLEEAYLQSKIDKVGDRWKGVDVDKYMDEVRGREPEQPSEH